MLARRHPTTHSILLVLAALVLGACNNNANEPNVASGVSVVSGDGQFATAGSATANPPVVLASALSSIRMGSRSPTLRSPGM